jgi:hypothetical protein
MNGKRDIAFKRCGCTSEETGRQLAGERPRLFEPGHGSWYYAVQVTTVGGRKARYRRGGFATREAAVTARHALLDGPSDQAAAGAWTLARWLPYWLKLAEPRLRPSTVHSYRDHIERYLIPGLAWATALNSGGPALGQPPASLSAALGAGAGLAATLQIKGYDAVMAPRPAWACCAATW